MSALSDRLTEIGARVEAATPGPWTWASHETADADKWAVFDATDHAIATNSDGWGPDAVFIATARNDMPALVAALRGVLEMHQPVEIEPSDTICGECSYRLPNGRYFGKVEYWPCPTVRAITEALEVGGNE